MHPAEHWHSRPVPGQRSPEEHSQRQRDTSGLPMQGKMARASMCSLWFLVPGGWILRRGYFLLWKLRRWLAWFILLLSPGFSVLQGLLKSFECFWDAMLFALAQESEEQFQYVDYWLFPVRLCLRYILFKDCFDFWSE